MHRLAADDARNAVLADLDRFAEQYAGVNAAHSRKAQKTVVRDVRNNQTDLVHMRSQHHFIFGALCAAFFDNQIAERVHGIGNILRQVRNQECTHGFFSARCAVQFTQGFKHTAPPLKDMPPRVSRCFPHLPQKQLPPLCAYSAGESTKALWHSRLLPCR